MARSIISIMSWINRISVKLTIVWEYETLSSLLSPILVIPIVSLAPVPLFDR
jgi:hypothetical protein